VLGPAVAAMVAAEFPLVQPRLYDSQIPPVVYLSGVLLFVAGLWIVRGHNVWKPLDWRVLITLTGWLFLVLGLVRMFGAEAYQRGAGAADPAVFMVLEGLLFLVGVVITVNVYCIPPRARPASDKLE
jgi:hypothetical protein